MKTLGSKEWPDKIFQLVLYAVAAYFLWPVAVLILAFYLFILCLWTPFLAVFGAAKGAEKLIAKKRPPPSCQHGVAGGSLGKCSECGKLERSIANAGQVKRVREGNARRHLSKELDRISSLKKRHLDHLFSLSPVEFEQSVARMYECMGYKANVTPASGDGGIDILLSSEQEKIAVECKRYNYERGVVGRPDVQKFCAAMLAADVDKGVFVTTAGFSGQAVEFAEKFSLTKSIELIDGQALVKLMERAYPVEHDDLCLLTLMCPRCNEMVEFYRELDGRFPYSIKCECGELVGLDKIWATVC